MKYLVVIGDGMADNPVEALGGRPANARKFRPRSLKSI